MTKVTLKEMIKQTSAVDIKRIRQFLVRELEAEKENYYTAFVDDGEESYDVNFLLEKDEILTHSCDCGSGASFCLHQKAVAAELSKNALARKKNKRISAIKPKRSPLEEFINDQDITRIKDWLLQYLNSNKQAAVEFKMAFVNQDQSYTTQEIIKKIDEVVDSVIGRKRRNIPASEIKKIVDLWGKVVQPIEVFIESNISNTIGDELFEVLVFRIQRYSLDIMTTSTRISSFIKKLYERNAQCIERLKSDADWNGLIAPLFNGYVDPKADQNWVEAQRCVYIYNTASGERKNRIATIIKQQILHFNYNSQQYPREILLNISRILDNAGLFKDCVANFFMREYNDEYNKILIHTLCEANPERAKEYCELIIYDGLSQSLDFFYMEKLEMLYEKLGLTEQLLILRQELFFKSPTLEFYIELVESVPPGETLENFKKDVTRSLRRSDYDLNLLMRIFKYEDDWQQAIEVLHKNIQIQEFWEYREELFAANPTNLLSILLHQGLLTAAYYKTWYPHLFREVPEFVFRHYTLPEIERLAPQRGYSKDTFSAVIVKQFLADFF
ncbi:MAG: hypothetical protein ACTIKE_15840 [Sphingobacterium sp.]